MMVARPDALRAGRRSRRVRRRGHRHL